MFVYPTHTDTLGFKWHLLDQFQIKPYFYVTFKTVAISTLLSGIVWQPPGLNQQHQHTPLASDKRVNLALPQRFTTNLHVKSFIIIFVINCE